MAKRKPKLKADSYTTAIIEVCWPKGVGMSVLEVIGIDREHDAWKLEVLSVSQKSPRRG